MVLVPAFKDYLADIKIKNSLCVFDNYEKTQLLSPIKKGRENKNRLIRK